MKVLPSQAKLLLVQATSEAPLQGPDCWITAHALDGAVQVKAVAELSQLRVRVKGAPAPLVALLWGSPEAAASLLGVRRLPATVPLEQASRLTVEALSAALPELLDRAMPEGGADRLRAWLVATAEQEAS